VEDACILSFLKVAGKYGFILRAQVVASHVSDQKIGNSFRFSLN
jgi:hypothetical protein